MNNNTTRNTITIQEFTNQNIIYCVSGLIYELTQKNCLPEEDAIDLWTGPIDYNAAAYQLEQEGDRTFKHLCKDDRQYYWGVKSEHSVWRIDPIYNDEEQAIAEWFEIYRGGSLEDYRSEVFEHYICSDYLGRKLKEQGHTVVEVMGLTIWARPTTGMSIAYDEVIKVIYQNMLSA